MSQSTQTAKRPVTYVVLILDQSGSMDVIRDKAVAAYNEQVQQAKINSVDQDIFCSLLTFNGSVFEHLWCVPADKLQESTEKDYICGGGTALNDAVGYAISKLKQTTDWNDPNNSYLIQTVTDGEENASEKFKTQVVFDGKGGAAKNVNPLKDLITAVQETKRWTFGFLGCSVSYLEKLAQETAVPVSNMAAWTPDNAQAAVLKAGTTANKYYRARSAGKVELAGLHSEDLCRAASYGDTDEAEALAENIQAKMATHKDANVVLQNLAGEVKCSAFANHSSVDWSAINQDQSSSNG